MHRGDRIYIIGFMGSGKTTVGRKLAAQLSWSFIDLDEEIEKATGKRIPEIFADDGEQFFREVESETLRNLEQRSKCIISTGGGTPCFGTNMEYMIETGVTMYLKMSPGQLKGRLSGSSGKRPLIQNIDKNELKEYIRLKLEEREKWYNQADLIVNGLNIEITSILLLLKKWIHN